MRDRAVSEIIGFILVFSLIIGTVSLVYVGGFAGLQDARDHEQLENAERAFDVLANNLESIASGDAPSRATEIKLSDATLTLEDKTEITVNTSGRNASFSTPRTIYYEPTHSNSAVIYEAGAVLRSDGEDARIIKEPTFIFGPNQTVVRTIETRGGVQSTSGDTTVLVRSEEVFRDIKHEHQNDASQVNMTIRIEPDSGHVDAWYRYLNGTLNAVYENPSHTCEKRATEVVCTDVMTHSVYFSEVGIDVKFV